jgi:hypothetical protein
MAGCVCDVLWVIIYVFCNCVDDVTVFVPNVGSNQKCNACIFLFSVYKRSITLLGAFALQTRSREIVFIRNCFYNVVKCLCQV